MTNTLFIFENKNLFKNLSRLIFQLAAFSYQNLLSLAWKNLGSYTRGFTESYFTENTYLGLNISL